GAQMALDRLDRLVHPAERRRLVGDVASEPCARRLRIAEPATHEHLRQRMADAKLALEREDVGDRSRWNAQAYRVHSPTSMRPQADGSGIRAGSNPQRAPSSCGA